MNETCLILGDSIAVGLASVIKGCVVVAKVGMSSTWIMANAPTMQADRVYISSGSNDPDNPALSANLKHTRAKIGGVITWIEPVNARAASVVAAVAAKHGDRVVSFTPGRDNVHPKSYEALGRAVQ
jgi:hypothetical protein